MIAAAVLTLALHADFAPNARLPMANVYTECGGRNISPALRWSEAPASTRSFVLTVFDPDAPSGGFWHWIAFNIPPTTTALARNAGAHPSLRSGTYAKNGFGHARYDGPCPPAGSPHRYVFTIYALDVPRVSIADGEHAESTLEGHILASSAITGLFGR